MSTKEHAMERYPSNPIGWGVAIDLLRELAKEEDVKRLSVYCVDNKCDRYLGGDDLEIFESWVGAFVGENTYYLICYGISGRFDWEPEEEDPFQHFERDDDNTGLEYYQAYHQWNAFCGWLTNHPAALENFNPFVVSIMNKPHFIYYFFVK